MRPKAKASAVAWALCVWLSTTAQRCPAPRPQYDFPEGVNGIPRGLANVYPDSRAAGFNAGRVFIHWAEIQTANARLDPAQDAALINSLFSCRYWTDTDKNGSAFWVDCDPTTPCHCTDVNASPPQPDCAGHSKAACGWSADERVTQVTGTTSPYLPALITVVETPDWAADDWAHARCGGTPAMNTRPFKDTVGSCAVASNPNRTCVDAWNEFVYTTADRYASAAYAFELWNEPNLCNHWSGNATQYKQQVLPAAQKIKDTGAVPGLVYAPAFYNPSGSDIGGWLDTSLPIDYVSVHLYGDPNDVINTRIPAISSWCNGNAICNKNNGFIITEFGWPHSGTGTCASPNQTNPGNQDVALMNKCILATWCWGWFQYPISDRTVKPECDMGLFSESGGRKARLCTIASNYFLTSPGYTCPAGP